MHKCFSLLGQLNRAIDGKSLDKEQLSLVKSILDQVISVGEDQPLSTGAQSSLMAVFCRLLSGGEDDATLGHYDLAQLFERYVFSFVAGAECTEPDVLISAPQPCDAVSFGVAKWPAGDVNGFTYQGKQSNTFQMPDNLLQRSEAGDSEPCFAVAFIEYASVRWFPAPYGTSARFLGDRVFGASVRLEPPRFLPRAVRFRIHTADPSLRARRARCVYYDEELGEWSDGNNICSVDNNLALALDDYVDCSCKHMSHYAVVSEISNLEHIGYPVWFHAACFVCIVGMLLAVLLHHICSRFAMFSASLLMHMCFAVAATEICYVVDAFISPEHLLDIGPGESNYRCIIMALTLHYFFLAQFTWMVTQAVNLWRILVLNDEHTERKVTTSDQHQHCNI